MKPVIFLILALCIQIAYAEKADGQKPLQIWAVSQTYDGNKKITVYNGRVHIEKGTLVVNADRMEIIETADGNKTGTLFGNPGKLVHYRQKRDGGPDLWAEGEAEKIVYDDALELIKLFNKAKLTLLDGKKPTHESSGIYISYDSRTDFMSVNNTLQGVSVPGAGFTNAVIYPSDEQAPSKPESKKNNSKSNTKDNP
jgi:lipopolysaccharide export system protein LptA